MSIVVDKLPSWYYSSSGDELTLAILRFCEYDYLMDSIDDYINWFKEEGISNNDNKDNRVWEDKICFESFTDKIHMIICYDESRIYQLLDSFRYTSKDVLFSFKNYRQSFDKFMDILAEIEEHKFTFDSIDSLISFVNQSKVRNDLTDSIIQLITKVIEITESEIKFFFHTNPIKIYQMYIGYPSLKDLLIQTFDESELVAKQYLGKLPSPERLDVSNYIDDVDFLYNYLDNQGNSDIHRYFVLESLIYRNLYPLDKMVELIENYYTDSFGLFEEYQSDQQTLIIYILKESISISVMKFVTVYSKFSNYILDSSISKVVDLILTSGWATDLVQFIHDQKINKLSNIASEIDAIMEPDEENDYTNDENQNKIEFSYLTDLD